MTIILEFDSLIYNLRQNFFADSFFFFEINSIIFMKTFGSLIKPFFQIWFEIISYYYLVSDIFSAFYVSFVTIKDKKTLRYMQNF